MKQTEIKSNVLQQLIDAMLGETGGKMKPKMVSIEVVKPIKGKEGLKDVLDDAAEHDEDFEESTLDRAMDKANAEKNCVSEDDWEDSEGDEEADEKAMKKPRMTLSEFLNSK